MTVFKKSQKNQKAYSLPQNVSEWEAFSPPHSLLRKSALNLPELSELDLTRHYIGLSKKNVGIDNVFYPLGSCTMKFNPRVNEVCANLPPFLRAHPLAPDETVQGCLRIIFELLSFLMPLTGLQAGSVTPNAGAQGELTGIQMIAAYHKSRGDLTRTEFLIPDSAHGTNPATVRMAGFKVKTLHSGSDGDIDLNELKQAISSSTAGLMLTNPNTLGLFSTKVVEIARLIHEAGGLLYYDGANFNPILTISKPSGMGFDVMHLNLHKTFSTPHGGGGPGAAPVLCTEALAPFLPTPHVVLEKGKFKRVWESSSSIGRVASFQGNFGIYLRALAYIKLNGLYGLRKVAENAVLNANYLKSKLKSILHIPFDGPCMHEFVAQVDQFGAQGVRALDVAKRLLDYGFYAPTVYFPLILKEVLLIEPTETESKRTLDLFVEAIRAICKEAADNPQTVLDAPHTLPVKRLDEVLAARNPILTESLQNNSGTTPLPWTITINNTRSSQRENELNDYLEKLESVTTELMEAKLVSEQTTKAKNAFLANVSHELRTPIHGIIGNLSLIQNTELTPKQEVYVTRIEMSAKILLELIGQVLDFSKIAAGELKVESIACDLKEILKEVTQILISKTEEKKLGFKVDLPEEPLPKVMSDPTRLKQMFINITGNAIKFTEKGEVRIHASVVSKTTDKMIFKVRIEDTGIGIPQDKMEHLFEKFWQADTSNTRKFGGTGLGLAITKELVDIMGGTITVASKTGEGTCFELTFPFPLEVKT